MLPPYTAVREVQSSAERRVAKLLAEIDLDHCAALYSFHLTQHARHIMGEVDFLVLFEDCFIAIEVKGGRIGRTDGEWLFTNREGHTNTKREGPFEQARRGMFAVRDVLSKRLPQARVGYASLVVTPNQALNSQVEWEPWEHAGPNAMSVRGLEAAILAARKHAVETARSRGVHEYTAMLRALRPDFDLLPKLSDSVAELHLEYVALRDVQLAVLAALDANPRILCEGGAGTGKTLVAAEAARRAAEDGSSVIFTCRSPRVVLHVAELLEGTAVRAIPFASLGREHAVDVLIVDEAQDLLNLDDLQVLDSAVVSGLERGRWRIFCDTNNQAHVDGRFDAETFREVERWGAVWRLTENVRNTGPVIAQTQDITGADLGTPRVAAGPRVRSVKVTRDSEAQALDEYLTELRNQDVRLETIAVVSTAAQPASTVVTESKWWQAGRLRPADSSPIKGVVQFYTAADIKGIEADHVCVIDIETVEDRAALARLYVAMSRPRATLWLAYSEQAWREIQSAARRGVRA